MKKSSKNHEPIIDANGEVRELTEAELRQFRPAAEVLSPNLYVELINAKRKGRGKNKLPVKERVSIRLSPDVVGYFRATGNGWQGRIDADLKDWVAVHG